MGDGNGGGSVAVSETLAVVHDGVGRVHVRRIGRVANEKAARVAELRDGDTASSMRYAQGVFQMAVKAWEGYGPIDARKPERHAVLGEVAPIELYESVGDECVAKVIRYATGAITAEQAGN